MAAVAAVTTTAAVGNGMAVDRVVLALNGQRYEVAGVDPSTRLLEFIRTRTPFKGPKLGCGEGTYASCT
jgi:abscisic-aldehyde oxidase